MRERLGSDHRDSVNLPLRQSAEQNIFPDLVNMRVLGTQVPHASHLTNFSTCDRGAGGVAACRKSRKVCRN